VTDHVTIATCPGGSHGTACTCGNGTASGLSRTGADQAREQHADSHKDKKGGKGQ